MNKFTPGPWNYDGSYVCTMRQEDGTVYVESWNPIADALLTKNVHYIATANPSTILAILAERADLKQQLVAAGITAENCELFRKDAERMTWLEDNYGGHTGGSGGFHMHMYLHTEAETVRDMIDAAMNK